MQSPLQDLSRFNYNNVISTATPTSAPYDQQKFRPSASDNLYQSTDKPNVFVHLNNRTKENVYKHHKQLHPSYTGSKRKPGQAPEKQFLPTPFEPENEDHVVKHSGFEPQHSFFTIEDAVTPVIPQQPVKNLNYFREEFNYNRETVKNSSEEPTATSAEPVSTQKPRQKLRRRKPKPKVKPTEDLVEIKPKTKVTEQKPSTTTTKKPSRGNISHEGKNDLGTRNRENYPPRARTRLTVPTTTTTTTTTPATSFEADYSYAPATRKIKIIPQTTARPTTTVSDDATDLPSLPPNVKRRLRYKSKLRTPVASQETTPETKDTTVDSQPAGAKYETVVKTVQPEDEFPTPTENVYQEVKLNLKLRNDNPTAVPTTLDYKSFSPETNEAKVTEGEEVSKTNKVVNRPRFSIKEYKKKSQTTTVSPAPSELPQTTVRPDRFNRLRVNLIRKKNETSEANKTTKSFVSENATQSPTPKRGTATKRTFPPRNATQTTMGSTEADKDTTVTSKPFIRNFSSFGSNRPTTPNLKSRIQNSKKKETITEMIEMNETTYPDVTTITTQNLYKTHQMAATDPPVKHETSIMKISKLPSSNEEKETTIRNIVEEVKSSTQPIEMDLTGSPSERVAQLTISGSSGFQDAFKNSANIGPLSRRIPNYFTISTDDPILPIQAFFPHIKANDQ